MKGVESKLLPYMDGHDKRFVIPVYQRNYEWKIDNCKQLFDDLVKLVDRKGQTHFFGCIVAVYNDEGEKNEFQIIDGQQRLTTMSLLLLSMYNLLKERKLISSDSKLGDKISDYLVDKYEETIATRIKLKSVKGDSEAFLNLFEEGKEKILSSNITTNYNYFCDRLLKGEISIDDMYGAIKRLVVIDIKLTKEDNPQLIFESLNSTGVLLSEGDKIRNLILMGLNSKVQKKFYETYWRKIENETENVSGFFRDFLTIKQNEIPAINKVYMQFKQYAEDQGLSLSENHDRTEVVLSELLRYAKFYGTLLRADFGNKGIDGSIERLNRLGITVVRPYLMEVFSKLEKHELTEDDVVKIFLMVENYVFRRSICELPTNALSKVFLALNREVEKVKTSSQNYVDRLSYVLLSKRDKARYPRDAEFREALLNKQIYLMRGQIKVYILERLENYGHKEDKDVYRHIDDGEYSIEHIMPQTLRMEWTKELGENYKEIHEEWLHRLGNLTLTGYNSDYSNMPFKDKRDGNPSKGVYGFAGSGIQLNNWVGKQEHWRKEEIETRNVLLVDKALNVWPELKTEIQVSEKPLDKCTLDDDIDLTGRKLIKYSFMGQVHDVSNWIDAFVGILRDLHYMDPTILHKIAERNSKKDALHSTIMSDESLLHAPAYVAEKIYVEKTTSTGKKITVLRQLFDQYQLSYDDLAFYLKEEQILPIQ